MKCCSNCSWHVQYCDTEDGDLIISSHPEPNCIEDGCLCEHKPEGTHLESCYNYASEPYKECPYWKQNKA